MARKSVAQEVLMIRRSFAQLAASFARLGPALEQVQKEARNGSRRPAPPPPPRVVTLTPRRRSYLKLQGRYMGRLRGLTPRDAASIKKIRAEKGLTAAISAAERMAE